MATLNKTQLYTTLVESMTLVFEENKVSKKAQDLLLAIIETNLKAKSVGASINPPKLIDEVMNFYCRFHERYEPIQDMVMRQDKSKGYCKASISLWNKTNSQIKKFDSEAVRALSAGDFDLAQEKASESKSLRELLNSPSHYDYEQDWNIFLE